MDQHNWHPVSGAREWIAERWHGYLYSDGPDSKVRVRRHLLELMALLLFITLIGVLAGTFPDRADSAEPVGSQVQTVDRKGCVTNSGLPCPNFAKTAKKFKAGH